MSASANPYRNEALRAAWSAGRRAFKRCEAAEYDQAAYKRGFHSVEKERFEQFQEAHNLRWRIDQTEKARRMLALEREGLSRVEIADRSGVHLSVIDRWLDGVWRDVTDDEVAAYKTRLATLEKLEERAA